MVDTAELSAIQAEAVDKIFGKDANRVVALNQVSIWISEGLAVNARVDQRENFKNVDERWRNPDWDPGRQYSAPWQ